MKNTFREYQTFFKEFRQTFHTTGAIAPSGRGLCRAVVKPMSRHTEPVRILEVGAGTGAATREIVKHIRPGDWFDMVELNTRFVETLQRRFETEPDFQRVASQSHILHCAVQQLPTDQKYDFIICGVPFNNFPVGLVKEILRHMAKLLKPGGTLSFFEYVWIRRFKALVANREERRRLNSVGRILDTYLARYEFHCDTAWINFPPAMAHHLRLSPASHEGGAHGERQGDSSQHVLRPGDSRCQSPPHLERQRANSDESA